MAHLGHTQKDRRVASPTGGWRTPRLMLAAGFIFAGAITLVAAVLLLGGGGTEPAASTLPALNPTGADLPQAAAAQTVPHTTASSWSATPIYEPPAAGVALTPEAQALAEQVSARYGIAVALTGQDWGSGAEAQRQNIAAVAGALEMLPAKVRQAIVGGADVPLAVLSNRQGRTAGGWQPYGNGPRSFYANSDQSASGTHATSQVVLATGVGRMTVAHELLHAYQLRATPADQYALALLSDEMRSLMAATGWTQVGTDAQVQAAAREPWSALNGLFRYDGRPLTYVAAGGSTVTIVPDNPLEAYATLGALYYARPDGSGLPDWPEYWAWFRANLG